MEAVTLEVQSRDGSRRAKDLLRENLIPAEYYGRGIKNRSLQMDYQTFRRLFRKVGSNTVIELNVDGKEKINVLVHDLARNPITDTIAHVDFINVRMDQEIHTRVPLRFVGVSLAVKDLGGIVVHHLNALEVKCLPKDLVHDIEVSIDSLVDFRSLIKVKDVVVPAGIKVMNNPDGVVVAAVPPRIEEEEVAPVAAEGAVEGAVPAEGAAPAVEGEAKAEGGAQPAAEKTEGGKGDKGGDKAAKGGKGRKE